MNRILLFLFFVMSVNAFAQATGPGFYPSPSVVNLEKIEKDPMILGLKRSIETAYGVKCGSVLESTIRTYFVEKLKVKCPRDSTSGVNLVLHLHEGDRRTYFQTIKIKPYGNIESQFRVPSLAVGEYRKISDPVVTVEMLKSDGLYTSILGAIESIYGSLICSEFVPNDMKFFTVDRYKTNCHSDSKSGVKLTFKINQDIDRVYLHTIRIKPFGDAKSQF